MPECPLKLLPGYPQCWGPDCLLRQPILFQVWLKWAYYVLDYFHRISHLPGVFMLREEPQNPDIFFSQRRTCRLVLIPQEQTHRALNIVCRVLGWTMEEI